jgi:lysophospholipase L1-like esterase
VSSTPARLAGAFHLSADAGAAAGRSRPPVYVAVGASETVGIGTDQPLVEAWTQVLYRAAFPRSATFVNLGVPGATVADALAEEAPLAARLAPDVVTVWLNVNDLRADVPAATYRAELQTLVSALRRGGATRVLIANTPPLDHLPAYLACHGFFPAPSGCDLTRRLPPAELNAAVDRYNAAIAAVAAREGAVVVDLHAAELAARRAGTERELIGPDGFHPSAAGARLVAELFKTALWSSWPALARSAAG